MTMKSEPLSPRTQKLVAEHLPLLEPFGVGRLDIANIVTECKYDAQAIALRVQALVNSKCDGYSNVELLWQRPKGKDHQRQPKPHKQQPKKNIQGDKNGLRNNKQATTSPTAAHKKPSAAAAPPQKPVVKSAKPETPAATQPAEIQHISSPISKPEDASRVRPGQTWAQRVKGDENVTGDVVEPQQQPQQKPPAQASVSQASVKKAARPAPPQVFSWVAAAQGKRLVREEDFVAPELVPEEVVEAQPEEEDEVEIPQPVPDRVCDMQCVSSEQVQVDVTPPAGFEAEAARTRYHPSSPPVIKQREQQSDRPPMYDQRAAANNFIQRTAYNAYQHQMKYAAYGLDYFGGEVAAPPPGVVKPADRAPVDNVIQRQLPPMYHHMPPQDAYSYESAGYARDYYMRSREPERMMRSDMIYGYSRPPVMPPMFATAAGRNEMTAAMVHHQQQHHQQQQHHAPPHHHPEAAVDSYAMYHHHQYAPRAPEFYPASSQWR